MTQRFKLRFPSNDARIAAQAIQTPGSSVVLENEKRNYLAIEVEAPVPESGFETAQDAAMDVVPELRTIAQEFGAEIVVDYQYDLEADEAPDFLFEGIETTPAGTLTDVTKLIKAEDVWDDSTGAGVTIAIVDTGIDGSHPEFPQSKRAGNWQPPGEQPWSDWEGHGTMCAAIAAASGDASGSRYKGVAPDARLIACKTRFFDSELGAIYDFLIDEAAALDRPLVASNSFGRRTGTPPQPPAQSDFIDALDDAIAAGILVFFSAGNNHELGGGDPGRCDPNTIWLHKSRADVFPVATCDLDRAMWFYSSRGPGQHAGDPGTSDKPDATAPTPRNGKILYGPGEQVLPNGWGTSGACPQVAGLAALMLSVDGTMTRADVFDAMRASSTDLGFAATCQGAGMIDCEAAMSEVRRRITS